VAATNVIPVGKIVSVHGLKGTVKVYSYAESPALFRNRQTIFLQPPHGQQHRQTIRRVKQTNRALLVDFEGFDTRERAQELIGAQLCIAKDSLPAPEEGSYYWSDLIGLAVYTTDEQFLGKLEAIIPTGSNDVYVVKGPDREVLIPALESVVQTVNLQTGIMQVMLPAGL
jgi:16S rRNA processing protein RimM